MAKPSDLFCEMKRELVLRGVPHIVAAEVSAALRETWGGGCSYLKKIDRAEIRDTIDMGLGNKIPARKIAQSLGVSISTVYRRRREWLG